MKHQYAAAPFAIVWLFIALCLSVAAVFAPLADQAWLSGRFVFAAAGAMVYGVWLPLFFVLAGLRGCVFLGWHCVVIAGVISVLCGTGSGLLIMPFAWWVCPIIGGFFVYISCCAWNIDKLLCAAAGSIAVGLTVLSLTQAKGFHGSMDVCALQACIFVGLVFGLCGRVRRIVVLRYAACILLIVAPLIGGLWQLQGVPVPWVLVECGKIWAWCVVVCGVAYVAVLLPHFGALFTLTAPEHVVMPTIRQGSGVLMCIGGMVAAALWLHGEYTDGGSVKRPCYHEQGARIYAAEGCGLCHTQVIRRKLDGSDLQAAIDRNGAPDFVYRVSESGDLDADLSGEGAAHMGIFAVGPDLSNTVMYVGHRLQSMEPGQKPAATVKEWLALHLYNPQEVQFGNPNSICPARQDLFELKPTVMCKPGELRLPVSTPEGMELVLNERGEDLVNYLLSLKREDVSPSVPRYGIFAIEAPEYAKNTPVPDRSKHKRQQEAIAFNKGYSLYMAKCAVCHGRDGLGDRINYPPLLGSEWVRDKSDRELIDIMQNGLTGRIVVAGREWNSTMLPPGITDLRDLAYLLTYLRKHFGKLSIPAYSATQIEALLRDSRQH